MAEKTKIIWKIEKRRYSPKFFWNRETNQQEFRGWYISKSETVYRDGKGAVTLSINAARDANESARRIAKRYPDEPTYTTYYSVRAWPVKILAVDDEPTITEIPSDVSPSDVGDV